MIPKEISPLAGNFEERLNFAQELLGMKKSTKKYKAIEKALIEALNNTEFHLSIRTAVAYLLAKLKVSAAIPNLGIYFLNNDFPPFFKSGYLNYSGYSALLEFGKESLPTIKKLIKKTNDEDKIWNLAMMLFFILKDKKKVENIVDKEFNKREKKDAKCFKKTIRDMKKWRMDE